MAYTKKTARHDKITISGTDVSNSFRRFGLSSEHSEEDVSGFSVEGNDETLAGTTARSFVGEAFYTEELGALVWPIHDGKTAVTITWQPDGLVDATREVYSGSCTINTFGPEAQRGTVYVMPFAAKPATSAGITVANWT